jgi:hypothetical protein
MSEKNIFKAESNYQGCTQLKEKNFIKNIFFFLNIFNNLNDIFIL